MIKPKIGNCKKGCSNVPLIAGYCQWHYWEHRASVKALKGKDKAKKLQKAVLGTYFANQAHKMPQFCEETGQKLPMYPEWLKRSCMAHILPKRKDFGFESVALHPMNMVFVIPEVHQNMDNLGESYIVRMRIYPLIKERVKELLPLLTEHELNKVPKWLKE